LLSVKLGNYDEAIQAYDEAIKLDPEYATAWYNKGVTLSKQGYCDEAIQAYDEAIRLNPEYDASLEKQGHRHPSSWQNL